MRKDLIARYMNLAALADLRFPDDYGGFRGKIKVLRNNRAVTRMLRIESDIEQNHPELKDAFARLLDKTDCRIHVAAAHGILERMHYDAQTQRRALTIIEAVACDEESVSSFGTILWLTDWYKTHPEFTPNEAVLQKREKDNREFEALMQRIANMDEEEAKLFHTDYFQWREKAKQSFMEEPPCPNTPP